MRKIIVQRLNEIEIEHDVRILYACESGSRSWGFASKDSDYDVRFIYVRPLDWYLSINLEHKRDVIELPTDGVLDINGWDLRKALKLLRKSNPPLLEWLRSPIVYYDNTLIMAQIRNLMPKYYSPKACWYHYHHMAKGNYREYLKGSEVWLKKYLYVIRPILAAKWIIETGKLPPLDIDKLLSGLINAENLQDWELIEAIKSIVRRKKEGQELGFCRRIPVINDFINAELKQEAPDILGNQNDLEELNGIFRRIVLGE